MVSGGFRTFLFLLWLTCDISQAAIFGVDKRTPITSRSQGSAYARSTAVAVINTNFEESGLNSIKLATDSMSSILCPDEKFAKDPSLSYACTGFLIGPDLLITAGHCATNIGESRNERGAYCAAFSWLFDYQAGVDFQNIPKKKLFGCKEIVYAIREEEAPFRDFAVIRLDHAVTDRVPLKLSTDLIEGGTPVSMVGYPFGTPAKYSTGARVLVNDLRRDSLITNLDAFEGNSGSPVFNNSGEVIGILVGGTPLESLVNDPVLKCKRYNRCDEDGTNCLLPDTPQRLNTVLEFQATGSIVQKIAPVIPWLEKMSSPLMVEL